MTDTHGESANPYAASAHQELDTDASVRRPGLAVILGMLLISFFAAICGFFCSCIGVLGVMRLVRFSGEIGWAILFILSCTGGGAAAFFAFRALYRAETNTLVQPPNRNFDRAEGNDNA